MKKDILILHIHHWENLLFSFFFFLFLSFSFLLFHDPHKVKICRHRGRIWVYVGRPGPMNQTWFYLLLLCTHNLRGPTQLDECFNFWYECFNFLPAFFHTLEIPPSLPKNPVHVTGSQRFWPLDVGLNTLTRNSAVLQCKFCPINFLLLTHTQCTFQVLFFRLRLRSGGRFVAISSLSSDLARPSITM